MITQSKNRNTLIIEEFNKGLKLKSLHERCKCLQGLLMNVSELELVDIFPQLITDIFNASTDWKLRCNRIAKSEEQALLGFLDARGALMLALFKLELNFSTSWMVELLKLPDITSYSISQVSSLSSNPNDGAFVTNHDNALLFNQNDNNVSPIAFFISAFFGYLIHPLNKKNDFWNDPNHWMLKLFSSYLNFFLPSLDGKGESIIDLPKFISDSFEESAAVSSYFNRFRFSDSEISLSITKIFCDLFACLLLKPCANANPLDSRPSVDHVRIVRLFVRHCHINVSWYLITLNSAFANRNITQSFTNSQSGASTTKIYESFYKTLLSEVLHKPIYDFLSQSIRNWPNDFPFRVVVECWLTYIQPWRVVSPTLNHQTQFSIQNDDSVSDLHKWQSFIDENIEFYTQMFQLVLPHLLRMDPSMISNSSVLFRIGKVFASWDGSLMQILRDSETKLLNLRGFEKNVAYNPLFTCEIISAVSNLIENCVSSVHRLKNLGNENCISKIDNVSFWTSIWNSGATDENVFDHSLNRPLRLTCSNEATAAVIKQLEESVKFWCLMFDLDRRCFFENTDRVLSSSEDAVFPEHVMGDLGPELTTLGRWQIMTGKKQFQLTFGGDPDLQPVRSFEFAPLVKASLVLSNKFNDLWGDKINALYNRNDLICRFLKSSVISGPLKFSPSKMASKKTIASKTNKFSFVPHVSLRFVASYYALFYMFIFFLLLKLLLPSWVLYALVLALIVFPLFCFKMS